MKQIVFTSLVAITCLLWGLPAKSQSRFYTQNGISYFPVSDTVPSSGSTGAIYINNTDKTIYRYNGKKWVTFCTGSLKPSVSGVAITSNATTSSIVTGGYTYVPDAYRKAAEGPSAYRWYWAVDNQGTCKTAISGATSPTYAVNVGEVYIAFGVTPISTGNATGNETISNWQKVAAPDTAYDGTKVVDLISSSGRIWMDRNLGALQQADSVTDYKAYGSIFQWCRAPDGHQLIRWTSDTTGIPVNGTTSTLSVTIAPSHSKFITNRNSPYDWLSTQLENGNLWWNGSSVGENNPCPAGYHVPTYTEWNVELSKFSAAGGKNATGAYNLLKLTKAGCRYFYHGHLLFPGSRGYYWSSTVDGDSARNLLFYASYASIYSDSHARGFSVRCIKDQLSDNDRPKAENVNINGTDFIVGNTVTGTYTYTADVATNSAEGTSTYQWYYATDAQESDITIINGATSINYTVASPVVAEKYLAFGVTPVSSKGVKGKEVLSNWQKVAAPDTAYDGTKVVDLISSSGRIWMDRNLGALQQADSVTDYKAYGSLFQWCRAPDGHEKINWTGAETGTPVNGTTNEISSTTAPAHSLFILAPNSPYDWLSSQLANGSLWWNGSSVGANNPCPAGYHVPTETEWQVEETIISNNGNDADAAFALLKLPMAGYRYNGNGSRSLAGSNGYYWSSTVNGNNVHLLHFYSSNAYMSSSGRANGFPVRCIKNE